MRAVAASLVSAACGPVEIPAVGKLCGKQSEFIRSLYRFLLGLPSRGLDMHLSGGRASSGERLVPLTNQIVFQTVTGLATRPSVSAVFSRDPKVGSSPADERRRNVTQNLTSIPICSSSPVQLATKQRKELYRRWRDVRESVQGVTCVSHQGASPPKKQ